MFKNKKLGGAAIILALYSSATMACTPNKQRLEDWKNLSNNVLAKAIVEDHDAKREPYTRFVKDEKQALAYIKAYSPEKRAFADHHCLLEIKLNNCTATSIDEPSDGLGPSYLEFSFLKGLIRGMELNKWSKSTIQQAEALIQKDIEYVLSSNPSVMNLIVSFEVIQEAQTAGFFKDRYKNNQVYLNQSKDAHKELKAHLEKLSKLSSCEQLKALYKKQRELSDQIVTRWTSSR